MTDVQNIVGNHQRQKVHKSRYRRNMKINAFCKNLINFKAFFCEIDESAEIIKVD